MQFDIQAELERKKKLDIDLEEGSMLLESGQFDQALTKLLFAFDNGDLESSAAAWRLRELASKFSPTLDALLERRNRLEALILDDRADLRVIHNWRNLNECLKDDNRDLEIYNEAMRRKLGSDTIDYLLDCVWRKLTKQKKYVDLEWHLRSIASRVLSYVSEYESLEWFRPSYLSSKSRVKEEKRRLRDNVASDGPLVYEVAVGLGNKRVASVLSKKMIEMEPSDRIFAGLVKAAIRAKDHELAESLFDEAKTKLSDRRLD